MTGIPCHIFCCKYDIYCDKIALVNIKSSLEQEVIRVHESNKR
jgi:hypothetical protein